MRCDGIVGKNDNVKYFSLLYIPELWIRNAVSGKISRFLNAGILDFHSKQAIFN
jgi:hypothetical protein